MDNKMGYLPKGNSLKAYIKISERGPHLGMGGAEGL